jgi:hypothetical protein
MAWMFQTDQIGEQAFWTTCFWGATALIISAMLKLSPKEWMEKVPMKIDENNAMGADSKLVAIYGKASKKQKEPEAAKDDDYFPPADNSEI